MTAKKQTNLPCPECWIDTEAVQMVTLLNRLGFETLFCCAGFGVARGSAVPPISRLPVKIRKKIRKSADDYYIEHGEHNPQANPYVMFKVPTDEPNWEAGVFHYLRRSKVCGSDLYIERFEPYRNLHLVDVDDETDPEGKVTVSMSREAMAVVCEIGGLALCREDVVLLKKMWRHEVVKAFSFI